MMTDDGVQIRGLTSASSDMPEHVAMRPASQVMDLNRLGSFHQSRLSFMRTLVRRMVTEDWQISSSLFELDEQGYGTVVFTIKAKFGTFSFVVFSHYLPPESRNDRVIANQWDLTMALCEGNVDAQQLSFLSENVPKQEAGRVDARVMVLSRANRSGRTFDYMVDQLARGEQPDLDVMAQVGYLYRTTAAYGSGKLGMADWEKVWTKHKDFARPFAAEMFTCYMLRHFSMQQVEHIAAHRSPSSSIKLDSNIKRYIGIGNSTGLGMAPFLINHPLLINQCIEMREKALAAVLSAGEMGVSMTLVEALKKLVDRVIQHLTEIYTEDARQDAINQTIIEQLGLLGAWLGKSGTELSKMKNAWTTLVTYAEDQWHVETQEVINTLLMELYPDLVDKFEESMWVDESYEAIPEMPVSRLVRLIEDKYDWALAINFAEEESQGVFWYRSEEKMEPRLGQVHIDLGMDKQMPLAVGRRVRDCYDQLVKYDNDSPGQDVAHFILINPTYSGIVVRIQTMGQCRYGDIRENLIHKDVLPIQLLRCKLSFFGVSKFDPRSRLWVRNTMFQGAPLISDFGRGDGDDWQFPIKPRLTSSSTL